MTPWFLAYPSGGRVAPLTELEDGSKVPWGGQDEGGSFVFAHVPLKAFTGPFHIERWPELGAVSAWTVPRTGRSTSKMRGAEDPGWACG